MGYDSEDACKRQAAGGVANPGLIRPPFVYLGSIGLGLLIHFYRPVQLLPASMIAPIGVLIILVAGILFVSAVRALRRANTPVPGSRPTTTIVRSGPYGFSRNPIYFAFSLFQVRLAVLVNSLSLLITLLPALAVMALIVILREERYLEARFPAEYLPYKRAVRRWL